MGSESLTETLARIEADIRRESRGRDSADLFIPARIRAGLRREAILAHRPPREIHPLPATAATDPDPDGDASDGFDYYHAAQADYQALCENQVGNIIPDEVWAEGQRRRALQDETSVELAKALDSTGRFTESPYYKGEQSPNRCTVIGLFSGAILETPAVKRSNALPSPAKVSRAGMLRFIEYFLSTLPGSGRKGAMFTITNGPRVAIHPVTLREEIARFHRWLSKMAVSPALKRWGVRMEWRASEFGSPKWAPGPGGLDRLTLHLHAHILVTLPDTMGAKQRAKMRAHLWDVFQVQWDDAGDIQNPREFVKYPVKDSDLQTILREGGPGVLADFVQAIRGLHIVQPMGEARTLRARQKATARRNTGWSTPDGRTVVETGDWNAGKRPLAKPNAHRAAYCDAAKSLAARLAVARFCRGIGTAAHDTEGDSGAETPHFFPTEAEENAPNTPDSARKTPPIRNRIMALLAPAPYGGPICEPAAAVWGFDGNLAAVLRQPRAAVIIARHRAAYEAATAARAYIRACAPAPAASEGSQRSNNCPPAAPPGRPWPTADLLAMCEN